MNMSKQTDDDKRIAASVALADRHYRANPDNSVWVQLDDQQFRALHELARRKGTNVSVLAGRAVQQLLNRNAPKPARPMPHAKPLEPTC